MSDTLPPPPPALLRLRLGFSLHLSVKIFHERKHFYISYIPAKRGAITSLSIFILFSRTVISQRLKPYKAPPFIFPLAVFLRRGKAGGGGDLLQLCCTLCTATYIFSLSHSLCLPLSVSFSPNCLCSPVVRPGPLVPPDPLASGSSI